LFPEKLTVGLLLMVIAPEPLIFPETLTAPGPQIPKVLAFVLMACAELPPVGAKVKLPAELKIMLLFVNVNADLMVFASLTFLR